MAHGRPDFFGMPIHPRYGDVYGDGLAVDCDFGEWTSLLSVEGKGEITGGVIHTNDPQSSFGDFVQLRIDGETVFNYNYLNLSRFNFTSYGLLPFFLECYDRDTPVFSVVLGTLVPFEVSFELLYYASAAGTTTVVRTIFYYLIEQLL